MIGVMSHRWLGVIHSKTLRTRLKVKLSANSFENTNRLRDRSNVIPRYQVYFLFIWINSYLYTCQNLKEFWVDFSLAISLRLNLLGRFHASNLITITHKRSLYVQLSLGYIVIDNRLGNDVEISS